MYKLSIIKYPSAKYGFVGSIPIELCELRINKICQEYYASKVYDTLQEAQEAQRDYELLEFDRKINILESKVNNRGGIKK